MSQQVFKMASCFIYTHLKFLAPFVNSTIHIAVRQTISSISQALPQVGLISN